jgi:hypothetical protein
MAVKIDNAKKIVKSHLRTNGRYFLNKIKTKNCETTMNNVKYEVNIDANREKKYPARYFLKSSRDLIKK